MNIRLSRLQARRRRRDIIPGFELPRSSSMRAATLFLLLLLALGLTACGNKGPLRLPQNDPQITRS